MPVSRDESKDWLLDTWATVGDLPGPSRGTALEGAFRCSRRSKVDIGSLTTRCNFAQGVVRSARTYAVVDAVDDESGITVGSKTRKTMKG